MCDQRSLPNVVSSLRPTPGIQSTIPFCNAADDHFATDDDSDSDIDLGIDVTEVVDVDVSSDEEVEGEDNSPSQQLHSRDKLNHREAFKATKDHRRASASAAIEYQRNIEAMRVTHEDEKKRFHYREKQQHRKVRKWLNKTLWNVERLETKGDYQPKVLSFSSVLHEVSVKNMEEANKSEAENVDSVVDRNHLDWTNTDDAVSFDEVSDEDQSAEVSEEAVKEGIPSTITAAGIGARAARARVGAGFGGGEGSSVSVAAHTTALRLGSVPGSGSVAARSSRSNSGGMHHPLEEERITGGNLYMDDDTQDGDGADYMIQHFTTFAYHGEDNDGVQL